MSLMKTRKSSGRSTTALRSAEVPGIVLERPEPEDCLEARTGQEPIKIEDMGLVLDGAVPGVAVDPWAWKAFLWAS